MLVSILINFKTKLKEQTGSTLATAAAIIAILAILAASMSVLIVNEMVQIIQYQNSTRAYYVAESGINNALWELNNWDAGANDGIVGLAANPISMRVGSQTGSYYTLFDRDAEVLRAYGTVGGVTRRISVKIKFNEYQFTEEFDNKGFMDRINTQEYKGGSDKGKVRWGYDPERREGIPSQLTLNFDPSGASKKQENPEAAVDSDGNIYVVWQDWRHGNNDPDVYIRKLKEINGELVDLWSPAGLRVNRDPEWSNTYSARQINPRIALDEQGNAFVVWQDDRNKLSTDNNWDIYAAKIDSESGGRWWDFKVNSDAGTKNQQNPDVAYSSGYAYVVWQDNRTDPDPSDIYAQKLDSSMDLMDGADFNQVKEWKTALGTPEDKLVDTITNKKVEKPVVCTSNTGNVYFAWQQWASSYWDIYARKLNSGDDSWSWDNPVKVNNASGDSAPSPYSKVTNYSPRIVADDSGNCYVTWERRYSWTQPCPGSNGGIWVQKLDSNGNRQWNTSWSLLGWDMNVDACCNPDIELITPPAPAKSYLYICYEKDWTVYARKFDPSTPLDGNPHVWGDKKKIPSGEFGVKDEPVVVGRSSGDATYDLYYVWRDNRNEQSGNGDYDVYAQRFSDGTSLWTYDREVSSEGGKYKPGGEAQSINVNTETTAKIIKYYVEARVFTRGSEVTFLVSAKNGDLGSWSGDSLVPVKAEEETAFATDDPKGSYFGVPGRELVWKAELNKERDAASLPYNYERSPAVDWVRITYWAGVSPDYSTWRSN